MTSFLNYTAPAPMYSLHGLAHLGQHNTTLKRYSFSSKARNRILAQKIEAIFEKI